MARKDEENQFLDDFGTMFQEIKRTKGPCPEAEILIQYTTNALSEAARAEIAEHVKTCAPCQMALAGLERSQEEMDEETKKVALADWAEVDKRTSKTIKNYLQGKTRPSGFKSVFTELVQTWRANLITLKVVTTVALLLIIVSPYAIYRMITLQKQVSLKQSQLVHEEKSKEELRKHVATLEQENNKKEMQLAELKSRSDETSRMYANPYNQIINIQPWRSGVPGSSTEVHAIKLPTEAQLLNLTINVGEASEYRSYLADIKDPSGTVLLKNDKLKRDKYGAVQLAIPKDLLKVTEYTLLLYGVDNNKISQVAEVHFRVIL